MKIVWEQSIYGGSSPIPCLICGRWVNPQRGRGQPSLIAVIYNDQGRIYGEACRSCVALGANNIKSYLQERITRLQAQLQDLQELSQGEVELPTLEAELRAYLD
ncbi:MAG: hypothetical protein NW237_02915 [Cyanobacteriota bacterium]|nr:hypothetical protein [Cyanobacteriota bacterium]